MCLLEFQLIFMSPFFIFNSIIANSSPFFHNVKLRIHICYGLAHFWSTIITQFPTLIIPKCETLPNFQTHTYMVNSTIGPQNSHHSSITNAMLRRQKPICFLQTGCLHVALWKLLVLATEHKAPMIPNSNCCSNLTKKNCCLKILFWSKDLRWVGDDCHQRDRGHHGTKCILMLRVW